ncbi:sulfite exporter TauE/SafE family protein [Hoeflea prorocentri]|uniref:Probable membrane transporter protein n=1 Tax=Hoeflea prorocentri TaxID=1922333 RepID=A0A9X3UDH6_9HYPH|nr:sulfite exporter TauE/SafE family protein [Hoeflea prorocentri]MCY6379276.1 sulfite exporter TauE/SafE family protein [Hoeflea prorocentri]MDA5397077.1 sulfite exporter TauE/SafE family protein [Hoeflea prorocentri]
MPTDFIFYAAAVPAVILVGLSKGGLGGAFALMGVPILALVISPVQAAAILLPIMIVMDIFSLWIWRHYNDATTLKVMLPGAMIGIGIGWLTASLVSTELIRLLVGLIAIWFVGLYVYERYKARRGKEPPPRPQQPVKGTFWATISGFTSFVTHAGGPPFQIYTLPLRLDPKVYVGTSTRYFAIVNAVKLIPYFALGQFDASNLSASFVLMPLAPLATLAGAWIVKRLRPEVFYPLMYLTILATSVKLVADGMNALLH